MSDLNVEERGVSYQPADPVAKGIFPTAKQAFGDLFHWKQRTVVPLPSGEERCEWRDPEPLVSPFKLFGQLSFKDWLFFICGFAAWCADAFDFHALSIQTVKFAEYYDTDNTNISSAITLTLLLRSVGAAVFGLLGDRFGRKWPMVINMWILGLLQIATIYSRTFSQFLAVRSLFGLFMGGVYGNAIAMALEHCPTNARGLMSGILQQGYSFGYVLAACASLAAGGETESWKEVFWWGAGLSIIVGCVRICFPESQQFLEAKKAGHKKVSASDFSKETKAMIRKEWRMCIYCVILMTWFNFYSHTSQDSYTTFMRQSKGLANGPATRASILMKAGACVGGSIIGYMSQWFGRRRSMIVAAFLSCCLIPAWILVKGEQSLSASGFMMQFFVQGAWGVIPIHLNELSPPAYRSTFPGLTYQIGNMISSPSAQIVNALSERIHVKDEGGPHVKAYGPVMGIGTAIIAILIIVTVMFGPEKKGRHFEEAAIAGAGVVESEKERAIAEEEKERAASVQEVVDSEKSDSDFKSEAATGNKKE